MPNECTEPRTGFGEVMRRGRAGHVAPDRFLHALRAQRVEHHAGGGRRACARARRRRPRGPRRPRRAARRSRCRGRARGRRSCCGRRSAGRPRCRRSCPGGETPDARRCLRCGSSGVTFMRAAPSTLHTAGSTSCCIDDSHPRRCYARGAMSTSTHAPRSWHAAAAGGGAAAGRLRHARAARRQVDGAEARPPPDLTQVPDAVPRIEPIRAGGPNKPYEALGETYTPLPPDAALAERGLASWYGRKFHGRRTASGEVYDMYAMTAAHRTLPLPSYVRVSNPANGRTVIVRVNDRGPFVKGRIIDLSYTAALKLGLLGGVAPVQIERITPDEIRRSAWQRGAPAAPAVQTGDEPPALAATPRPRRQPLHRRSPAAASGSSSAPSANARAPSNCRARREVRRRPGAAARDLQRAVAVPRAGRPVRDPRPGAAQRRARAREVAAGADGGRAAVRLRCR